MFFKRKNLWANGRKLSTVRAGAFALVALASALLNVLSSNVAHSTPFTTTIPGTADPIPPNFPEAGGIVLILVGANGNYYFQFVDPATMFTGFSFHNGVPAAYMGNPTQLGPTFSLDCGTQGCTNYFGGSIARMDIRFTARDGDTRVGNFDFNDITLQINGFNVGNWSPVATETTSLDGTTSLGFGTGFGDNLRDTGWFQSTDTAMLNNILTTGQMTPFMFDTDPDDNLWFFNEGPSASGPTEIAAGWTLDKTALSTSFATVGQTLNYTYDLENVGSVQINNISVTDNKIATVSCPSTSLAPDTTMQCTASYVVTQVDIDAGSIANTATVTGAPVFGTVATITDNATVPGPAPAPALTVAKSAAPSPFGAVGSSITYTFAIQNSGNVTLSNISVTDPLIPALSCSIPTLAPGITDNSCTGSYIVTQADIDAGSITNTATASGQDPNGTPTSNTGLTTTTGPPAAPALTVAKSSTTANYNAVGNVLNYEYLVTNTGNVTLTAAVTVADNLIASVSCPGLPPGGLAPGGMLTCTANYTVVQVDLDAGSATNTASASSGSTTSPDDTATVNAVQSPALSLSKALAASSPTSFNAVGNTLSYEYTLTNTGNVTLTGAVTVADDKTTVTCPALPPGGLAPTATHLCTASYAVTQVDLDAGSVTNTASGTIGVTTSPNDSVTVSAVQSPALGLVKNATNVNFQNVGDTVDYDYIVTNTGNVTLTTAVTVSDNRIATVNCPALPPGGLAPTASITCTGTHTVTQGDLDLGSVTNIATASSGGTTSAQATETIPSGTNPGLTIVKTSPTAAYASVGNTLTYNYQVTNTGDVTLTAGIDVVDDKIGTISCYVGNLTPSQVETCSGTYTVTQADLDAGSATNQAFAQTVFAGSTPVISATDTATVNATRTPVLTVTKAATPAAPPSLGTVLTYTITVANSGNQTVSNISVSDPLIPSLSCTIISLAPTASDSTCTGTYTVTQTDVDAGQVVNTATANGVDPQGGGVTDDGSLTRPTVAAAPAVQVTKTANPSPFAAAGDPINYTFTVQNTGNVTLNALSVTDPLIPSLSCNIATIAPGQSDATCTGSYTTTQTDVDAGGVTNTATVSSTSADPSGQTVTDTDVITTNGPAHAPQLTVSKSAVPATYATAGDILAYTIAVQNTGNVTVVNTVVTDPKFPSLSCTIPTLAPGASDNSCTASHTVTQAEVDAGSISNTASATGQDPTAANVTDSDTLVTNGPAAAAALTVTKSATPAPFGAVGSQIAYTIAVQNTGNVTVTGISVTDPLLPTLSCTIASLIPGQSSSICTGNYTVTQADVDLGSRSNTAVATGTDPNSATVTGADSHVVPGPSAAPGLTVVKTSGTANYSSVGDTISYSYQVTNSGNVTVTSPVSVADNRVASVSCPNLPPTGLAPGAFIICTGSDTATQADLDAGSIVNTASATSGGTTSPNVSETVNAVQSPALSVVKSLAPTSATSYATVGDMLSYTYLLTNTGNVTLTGAQSVTDDYTSVSCPALPPSGLAPGATNTCTSTYVVTQSDLNAGSVTNTATATIGGTTSPADTETVNAVQSLAMSVVKTASNINFGMVGDTIDYTYVVTNDGNTTIINPISVIDNTIASVTCPPLPGGGVAPGATHTCTAQYTVTQNDLNFGRISNLATATDGTTTSPQTSETVPNGAMPALMVTKSTTTANFAAVNDTITYSYLVENTGTVTLTDGIRVVDDKIGTINCFAGNFVVGMTTTCTGTYTVTQADLDAGFVTNQATAQSRFAQTSPMPVAVTSAPDTVTVNAVLNPAITVTKLASPSAYSNVGQTLTYTITVANTGNQTVDNINITDPMFPALSCNIPSLAPSPPTPPAISSDSSCTATHTVTQADIDAGQIVNTATARGNNPQGGTVENTGTLTTSGPARVPFVQLTKNPSPTTFADVGDPIVYSFVISNVGNVTLSSLTVTDPLLPSLSCSVATLAPGQSDNSCSGSYTTVQSDVDNGSVTNTATVNGEFVPPSGPSQPVSNTTTVNTPGPAAAPALSLSKMALTASYGTPGQTLNYQYAVTNSGNVTLAGPITVSDNRIVSVSCPPVPGGGLAPGAQIVCTGSDTTTQSDVDNGSVTNTATATDGSVTSPADSATINAATTASIAVVKAGTLNPGIDGRADVGDAVSYTFTVQNTGNQTLTNVILADPGATVSGGPIVSLAPGTTDMTTFTASRTLTQADIDAGSFSNQTTVTGTDPSSSSVTDLSDSSNPADGSGPDDPTVTPLPVDATIVLVKTATVNDGGDGRVDAGDTVSYAFSVQNTGNVTLTNIFVSDPVVTVSGGPITTLAPGATDTTSYTASYTITAADINAGSFSNSATVTGRDPPNNPVTDISDSGNASGGGPDDPTVSIFPAQSSVELIKSASLDLGGNGRADAGDVVTYSFTVTNTGNTTLTGVAVTDPTVAISGSPIATLSAGGSDSTTVTGTRVLTQADVDSGSFSNSAIVSGNPPTGPPVMDTSDSSNPADGAGPDDPTVQPLGKSARISLVKSATLNPGSNGQVDAGDTITYSFFVQNTGNVTLTNVTISDPLVTMLGGPIGSLAPGVTDTTTFTASYTITQTDVDNGSVSNTATVTANDPDNVQVSDLSDSANPADGPGPNDPTVVSFPTSSGIVLIKTGVLNDGGNGRADVGDVVNYTFSVQNTGTVTLNDVTIADPAVTISGFPIGIFPPGTIDTTTFTATHTLTQADVDAGSYSNSAVVTGTDPDSNPVTDTSDSGNVAGGGPDDPTVTQLPAVSSMALIKTATVNPGSNGRVDAGDTVTYTFSVQNTGNTTLTGVTVTDPLVTMSGGPIASMAPGGIDTTTFTATYTITQADVDAGSFSNQATATGTAPGSVTVTDLSDSGNVAGGGPNDPTISTFPSQSSVELIKTATLNAGSNGRADAGDTITYAFTVTNTGNTTLTAVTVTDPVVTMSGGPIASLAPGTVDTTTFTATHTLTQAEIDSGSFSNTAVVTSNDPGNNPITDTSDSGNAAGGGPDDPTVQPLAKDASIALIKTATLNVGSNGIVDAGDTITYAFSVENTGNVTLTNVGVTDPVVTMSGGPIASLAPGVTDPTTFTATYTLTQADVDNGSFTNSATATSADPDNVVVTDTSDSGNVAGGGPDDPTVATFPTAAAILLIKTSTLNDGGNGRADVGDTITYAFTVQNSGNKTLTNVTISDPAVTMSGGPITSLAPGVTDSTTFTASHVLTQADVDAGSYSNSAVVTGTDPDSNPVTDTSDSGNVAGGGPDDPTVTQLPAVSSMALIKTATVNAGSNARVDAGDTVTYTFSVQNTGNTTLTSVSVTDPLVTMSGGPIASLAPGAIDTTTFTATYTITQVNVDAGSFSNSATVTGNDPGNNPIADMSDSGNVAGGGPDDPTVSTFPSQSSVELIKTATLNAGSNGRADAGDTITYAFSIQNTGNTTLTAVTVTDPLVTMSGGPIVSLAPGATDTTTFTATHTLTQAEIDSGSFSNTAVVTSNDPGNNPITDTSDSGNVAGGGPNDPTVQPLAKYASIALIKTATLNAGSNGIVDAGDTISYAFSVENTGNVTLTNVGVADPLVTMSGGPIASLAPGVTDTTTFSAIYTITQVDVDNGSYTNSATVTGTDPDNVAVTDISDSGNVPGGGPDDPTVTDFPVSAGLSLVKTGVLNDGGDGRADTGDTVTYAFAIENIGNQTITNVTISDPSVNMSGGPIVSLAPGITDATTFTATHVLTQGDVNAGSYSNTATATGSDPDNNPVTDVSDSSNPADGPGGDDPTVTPLPAASSLELIKTATVNPGSTGRVDAGDTVTYAFSIENTGNTTLTGVTLTDPLVTMSGGPIASMAPGDTDTTTFTATHTLTQADIDAGSFSNSATVGGTAPGNAQITDASDSGNVAGGGPNDPTVASLPAQPGIALIKTATINDGGDGRVDVGDTIVYAFSIENTGNVTLANVTVIDPSATISGSPIASLAPGVTDTTSITGVHAITQAEIDSGTFSNSANVTGNPPTGPPVSDTSDSGNVPGGGPDDPTVTTLPRVPGIALVKTAAPLAYVQPGDVITYTMTAQNTGNVTLTTITISDVMFPALMCNIAQLLPGQSDASCTVNLTVTQADIDNGQIDNTATARASVPGTSVPVDTTGSVTVQGPPPAPALSIAKTSTTVEFFAVGETVPYEYTVTNTGNITITAPITVSDDRVNAAGDTVACPALPVGGLAPLQSITCTATYDVTQTEFDAGSVANIASATSGPVQSPQATLIVPIAPASVAGVVFRDTSGDGNYQSGEPTLPGFTVQLVSNGTVIGTGGTNNSGAYLIEDIPPGTDYRIVFINPDSPAIAGGIVDVDLVPGENLTDQNLAIDPSGVIYNSETRAPVSGATVRLTTVGGTVLPNACLVNVAQQNQITGGDGQYRFDIIPGAHSLCPVGETEYRLAIDRPTQFVPRNSVLVPSEILPIEATFCPGDAVPGGSCQPVSSPAVPLTGGPTTHYMSFLLEDDDPDVVNNHIPLDPFTAFSALDLTKTTPLRNVRVGQLVPFTITARNNESFTFAPVTLIDYAPAGLNFIPGSAQVDGVATEPVVNGRQVQFFNLSIPPNGEIVVTLLLGVAANAELGDYTNRARVVDSVGNPLGPDAVTTVTLVPEHVFDCGEVIGKVYDDKNRDGYQNPGEPGLPSVRVATVNGELITTDKHGRFHVACADIPNKDIGSNYILKLDKRTLPTGYDVTTENPRVVRLTRGKVSKLNFGAAIRRLVRLDLRADAFQGGSTRLKQRWADGVSELIRVLEEKEGSLRLTYYATTESRRLADKRLKAIERAVRLSWDRDPDRYRLPIELRLIGAGE